MDWFTSIPLDIDHIDFNSRLLQIFCKETNNLLNSIFSASIRTSPIQCGLIDLETEMERILTWI